MQIGKGLPNELGENIWLSSTLLFLCPDSMNWADDNNIELGEGIEPDHCLKSKTIFPLKETV